MVATPHQPFYQLDLRVLGVMYIVILSLTSSMRPSFTVQLKFDVVHVRLASVYQELLIAIECSAIISTILTLDTQHSAMPKSRSQTLFIDSDAQ